MFSLVPSSLFIKQPKGIFLALISFMFSLWLQFIQCLVIKSLTFVVKFSCSSTWLWKNWFLLFSAIFCDYYHYHCSVCSNLLTVIISETRICLCHSCLHWFWSSYWHLLLSCWHHFVVFFSLGIHQIWLAICCNFWAWPALCHLIWLYCTWLIALLRNFWQTL